MPLTKEERQKLYAQAKQLRKDIVDVTSWAGGAHIGGGMSVIDILTILYFKYLNINPKDPCWEERDRLVLSKGHAAVAYVPVLARRGFFDVEDMKTFNKFKSPFGMHPDSCKVCGCDASTGSLGHGLPMAVGMALGARVLGKNLKVYCVLGRLHGGRPIQTDQSDHYHRPKPPDDRWTDRTGYGGRAAAR
jgi:transketolase